MTSIFYIVNESISILENAIRTGLPVPEKLKSIIRSLGKSEESSEISDEKEENDNIFSTNQADKFSKIFITTLTKIMKCGIIYE